MITILKAVAATTLLLLTLTFWLYAALPDTGTRNVPVTGISHSQLEADRIMTQRMGIQAQMPMGSSGMLLRSSDPAYVRALEQHSAEIDRMLGRAPNSP
ncbi:MAG TPA: hypothetical protein VFF07_11940 [Actinomycetota bacterium]|nr:hypothetical protein [Actinomycetota bacterium]